MLFEIRNLVGNTPFIGHWELQWESSNLKLHTTLQYFSKSWFSKIYIPGIYWQSRHPFFPRPSCKARRCGQGATVVMQYDSQKGTPLIISRERKNIEYKSPIILNTFKIACLILLQRRENLFRMLSILIISFVYHTARKYNLQI